MLALSLKEAIKKSIEIARKMRHICILPEHVLLSFLLTKEVKHPIFECTPSDLDTIRTQIFQFLQKQPAELHTKAEKNRQTFDHHTYLMIEKAVFWSKLSGYSSTEIWHVCLAMLSDSELFGSKLLMNFQISPHTLLRQAMNFKGGSHDPFFSQKPQSKSSDTINDCLTCLTDEGQVKNLEPLIGREEEMKRIVQILCRKKKNNAILIGDAGVGKSAIMEGLALMVYQERVPLPLRGVPIYALNLARLLAGTKYRGDFEQRAQQLIEKIQKIKGILAIDEIHLIMGAGGTQPGQADLANLLKPVMANGTLKILGATTLQEYQRSIQKDRAMARRFQPILVHEPSGEELKAILAGVQPRYEAHHQVKYSAPVIDAILELCASHENERAMPDQAIDLMDELGAFMQISGKAHKNAVISSDDFLASQVTTQNYSTGSLMTQRKLSMNALETVEEVLRQEVFGQNKVIENFLSFFKTSTTRMSNRKKPLASFLLAGPAGVGKTHFSLLVAKALKKKVLRLNMSEFHDAHTAARLLGAPPGYVGSEQMGLLTQAISCNPQLILLLDDIEKAHPQILDLFLQIMDAGILTDASGQATSFANAMIMITTQAGSTDEKSREIGFAKKSTSQAPKNQLQEIAKHFPNAFYDRIDCILNFLPLDSQAKIALLQKQISKLSHHLLMHYRCMLCITRQATQWMHHAVSILEGNGRAALRWFDQIIHFPIAELLLAHSQDTQQTLTIHASNKNRNLSEKKAPLLFSMKSASRKVSEKITKTVG